ncbi:hypothetical protein [Variovorax sp. DT-64]|uniref:hypothetical protein n=1 Tax=Variovorax sp. DT-64 TaxID=3396160 RepID=UPI003F1AF0B3
MKPVGLAPLSLSPRTLAHSESESEQDWAGVEMRELDSEVSMQPDETVTSPLLLNPDPDPNPTLQLVDPSGGSIRFAAVKKDCPRHVNVALAAVAGGVLGGMAGGVAGVVVKQAADLTVEASYAASAGGVAAGVLLGSAIGLVLAMWGEKCL